LQRAFIDYDPHELFSGDEQQFINGLKSIIKSNQANLQYAAMNVMNPDTKGEWKVVGFDDTVKDYPSIFQVIKMILHGQFTDNTS